MRATGTTEHMSAALCRAWEFALISPRELPVRRIQPCPGAIRRACGLFLPSLHEVKGSGLCARDSDGVVMTDRDFCFVGLGGG